LHYIDIAIFALRYFILLYRVVYCDYTSQRFVLSTPAILSATHNARTNTVTLY